MSAKLGMVPGYYIAEYGGSTNQLDLFRSRMRRDTVSGLNYVADDLKDVLFTVIPGSKKASASKMKALWTIALL